MHCTIRPLEPLSAAEERHLRHWLEQLPTRSVDAAGRIGFDGRAITVRADGEVAHQVAIVAMRVLGRPFRYAVSEARG